MIQFSMLHFVFRKISFLYGVYLCAGWGGGGGDIGLPVEERASDTVVQYYSDQESPD